MSQNKLIMWNFDQWKKVHGNKISGNGFNE